MSSYSQGNPQAYPSTPTSYPLQGQAYPPTSYVAPPPMGYPTADSSSYSQQVPSDTKNRGDGFWKGCCAALCCCCVLDACF
ncbi:cysteine-rich and transmembrane domain-containing protein A-like [Phalaenopsis equestris]|uniref:cysteine-rich and transmembrane domain-containing protein A-like n=1 Tax=Phalaenopsis equestris TaxID=78828 RepID=UPI0009E1A1EB|nr:cysteine-rich and transmembrane domain-containing protein A-like [Phalaenopsis equestris]